MFQKSNKYQRPNRYYFSNKKNFNLDPILTQIPYIIRGRSHSHHHNYSLQFFERKKLQDETHRYHPFDNGRRHHGEYTNTYNTQRILNLILFHHQALTDAQKELIRSNSKKCIGETSVDNALVQKMRGGDFDIHDEKLNNYVFCMMTKSSLITEEGVFRKDIALSKVGDDIKDVVSKAIDACIGETGATKEEKVFNYLKCYHKERPNHDYI